jgi:hypothetical protein
MNIFGATAASSAVAVEIHLQISRDTWRACR